jgi:hypothetical protein
MPKHTNPNGGVSAVDELVSQLLSCGAVLSQIISHMVRFESSGRSAPDAAPIPDVAHELISGVLTEVRRRHSSRDLLVAGRIIGEVTDAIAENIFFVDPDELEERGGEDEAAELGG